MGLILFSEKKIPVSFEIKNIFRETALRKRAQSDVFRLDSRKPFYLFV